MKIKSCKLSDDHIYVICRTEEGMIVFRGIQENIIRCTYTKKETISADSPVAIDRNYSTILLLEECLEGYSIKAKALEVWIDKETGHLTWKNPVTETILLKEAGWELTETPLFIYSTGGEQTKIRRVMTVDGERSFIENLKPQMDHMAYKAKLYFEWQEDEQIHGLGQGEEGIYNYRSTVQYLYQHNMRIPIPFLQSSKGYGILLDCGSLMTFNDDVRGSYLYLDCVEQLDYYMIAGEQADTRIAGYRTLTGKAAMLPKWAFGYIQSKEAYKTQQELVSVVEEYRKRKIPIDGIVQDWNTWKPGEWGNKRVDKERYPNISQMNQALHSMHVHSMVSVWPNMSSNTEDYAEMKEHQYLLSDDSTYNAFSTEARALYWKQLERELFSGGFDSWWCDSTEPFSGPDWNGEYKREPWERFLLVGNEHKKFLRADRANLYAVFHAKGIFENQRKATPKKRVLNLTRSGYAGSQRYGTMLWSGDTSATWETLRKQITEGLTMCLSGIPYWTLDIGGFFTVNRNWKHRGCGCETDPTMKWFWKGDYEEGVADFGYRELYVRWFEFGAFLPMFRSHGTDTPREVWQFGECGDLFYDALTETIKRRYQLMPYIYSMAGKVWLKDFTIVRSLLFDFPEDKEAASNDREFMFGESLLVCPVTEPMYYKKESQAIHTDKTWECYLPNGTIWYDYYTGTSYKGGQTILAPSPIDRIPVFIRAGAIIPMEAGLSYAEEEVDTPFELHIYPGKDGSYELYEDDGEGYGYENGDYNLISIRWEDDSSTLHIGASKYRFRQGMSLRTCVITVGNKSREVVYEGKELTLTF